MILSLFFLESGVQVPLDIRVLALSHRLAAAFSPTGLNGVASSFHLLPLLRLTRDERLSEVLVLVTVVAVRLTSSARRSHHGLRGSYVATPTIGLFLNF